MFCQLQAIANDCKPILRKFSDVTITALDTLHVSMQLEETAIVCNDMPLVATAVNWQESTHVHAP